MKKTYLMSKIAPTLKALGISVALAAVIVGCASKNGSLENDPRLAEADLFDGLKDQQQTSDSSNAGKTEEPLMPAEDDSPAKEEFSADNIVRGDSNGEGGYSYYYVAVGGESIGRMAHALYNNKKAWKRILAMNPGLTKDSKLNPQDKIFFDMRKASPRAEFLTKDMIERYKSELHSKIKAKRLKAEGNATLSRTTVQRGETLQGVSQRLYGTTRLWTELYLVNKNRISNFDNLKVGTEIDYYPVSDFLGGGAVAGTTQSDHSPAPKENLEIAPPPAAMPAETAEVKPLDVAPVANAEANPPTPAASDAQNLPADVKVTEKPLDAVPADAVVKGGIPVEGDAAVNTAEATPGGRAVPTETRRIRPPEESPPPEEEGFFSGNLRRFVYIGFIAIVFAGGIYLTRPNRKFKNRFTGIQPMPNPMAGSNPAPRPRVMPSTPNRMSVSKPGGPPDKDEKKTG